jgi:hypothetical protein
MNKRNTIIKMLIGIVMWMPYTAITSLTKDLSMWLIWYMYLTTLTTIVHFLQWTERKKILPMWEEE